jgi:nucleotide-binding universal stress UspA family protein
MYQRILVPFDGSSTSNRGLDEAIQLATLTGARLRLVHMIELLLVATGFETAAAYVGEVVPLMKQAGERILREGQVRAEKAGVTADTFLVDNITTGLSDAVADQVKAWGADLIVIGTHGRRGVGRLLLGSDAEQIVRTATVPVLLVRTTQATTAAAVTVPADASVDAAAHRAPCDVR